MIEHEVAEGFNAALVFYPACGLRGRFNDGYRPYAPVRVFHGTADEEVSYRRCRALVERSAKDGGDITIAIYPGAVHGFDDPGRARQANPANAKAKADAMAQALRFFRRAARGVKTLTATSAPPDRGFRRRRCGWAD